MKVLIESSIETAEESESLSCICEFHATLPITAEEY